MEFSEKLNYLFKLCNAEGKELAAAMNVTPPQVSKMRRGDRGLPRNKEAARTIAAFFASRCGSDYQRESLAKTLRVSYIRSIDKVSVLTDILLAWLADEGDPDQSAASLADNFLRDFNSPPAELDGGTMSEAESRRILSTGKSSFFAYYGGEGRRWAVQSFWHYILQQGKPCTINVLTDEDVGWMTEDPSYPKQLQASMVRLTEIGCVFRRVAAPISDMDQAFESLNRWLPLYLAGKATSYYYKRMRDNLNRVTILTVADTAALFSFSIGPMMQSKPVTFFTTDKKTVASMTAEFENYFVMCEPIMNVYSMEDSPKKLYECMLDYEGCRGSCIQRTNTLSLITLPWDVAMAMEVERGMEKKSDFLIVLAQRHKKFQLNLETQSFTDIMRLSSIDDIMAGKVPVSASFVLGGEMQYYTPVGYKQHLQGIVFMLEHHINYHCVLQSPDAPKEPIVYVKEGSRAILVRQTAPFSVFEVSERYLVDAFAENLRRSLPIGRAASSNRRNVINELKAHIGLLEERMRQDGF